MSLPYKIKSDENGETWLLPNKTIDGKDQFVYKTGGEAPSRKFNSGILAVGSMLKSTNVIVDFNGNNDMSIDYRNDTGKIAKESWYVIKNGVILDWFHVDNNDVIISDIPIQETVGGYTVTDYEKEAVKERILSNDDGELRIQYKIHEGKPLKHTLDFTSLSSGVYTLCQEFSQFEFDELVKNDVDSNNVETILTADVKTEITDISEVESLPLSKAEKADVKSDLQLSLPEEVQFKKNGKLVLGEITSGAKNDFKSFEFDSKLNKALFCYGEFSLNVGESFNIDPDTYSSNNPTIDAFVETNDASGVSCPTSTYTINDGLVAINVFTAASGSTSHCDRGYFEWSTSTIPDTAVISNTVVKLEVLTATSARNTDWNPMGTKPSTSTGSAIWTDIGDGTSYLSNDSTTTTVGTNKSIDLGSSADSDLQSKLGVDWFAVGLKFNSEARDVTHLTQIYAEESGTGIPLPTLEVTYTNITKVVFDVNYANGTAAVTGSVTQSNATTSRTISMNSTGFAGIFTGLTGNQNATYIDPDNFITNKTRNFSPASTIVMTLNDYATSCSVTGSANDLESKINNTNGHTITAYTTPICTTGLLASVFSWNTTFNKDGKTSVAQTSKFIGYIQNITAYGNKNPIHFFVNNTETVVSLTGNKLTSNSFTVGSGNTSFLLKFYLWLDPKPDSPTGASATGVSTSQIDLSWTTGNSGVSSISGYRIFVSSDGGVTYSILVSDTGSTTTSYGHSGLTVGSLRYYKVAAINSYGVGQNTTAFSGTTLSSSSSSTGGGGGGGPTQQTVSGFTLNLLPKIASLFLGETKTFDIDFTWNIADSSKLTVKSITIPSGDYNDLSIIPEQLSGSGKEVIDGKSSVRVTVQAPNDICSTENPTAKCVNLQTYKIPVQIFVQDAKLTNFGPYTAILELTIIKQVATGTAIILVVLAAIGGAIGIFIWRTGDQKPTHPKSPKEHKKAHNKVLKSVRETKKKPFFKKLFS